MIGSSMGPMIVSEKEGEGEVEVEVEEEEEEEYFKPLMCASLYFTNFTHTISVVNCSCCKILRTVKNFNIFANVWNTMELYVIGFVKINHFAQIFELTFAPSR